jgi:hypothetical protein
MIIILINEKIKKKIKENVEEDERMGKRKKK